MVDAVFEGAAFVEDEGQQCRLRVEGGGVEIGVGDGYVGYRLGCCAAFAWGG